jgi:hypothetical protein
MQSHRYIPIEPKIKLGPDDDEVLTDISKFQKLVGYLIYLTITRLDIIFAINEVSHQ